MALNPNGSEIPSNDFSEAFLRSYLSSPAPPSPVSPSLLPPCLLQEPPVFPAPCAFQGKEKLEESGPRSPGGKGWCQSPAATPPRRSAGCRPATSLCLSLVLGTGAGGEDRLCNRGLGPGVRGRVSVHSAGRFSSDLRWVCFKILECCLLPRGEAGLQAPHRLAVFPLNVYHLPTCEGTQGPVCPVGEHAEECDFLPMCSGLRSLMRHSDFWLLICF